MKPILAVVFAALLASTANGQAVQAGKKQFEARCQGALATNWISAYNPQTRLFYVMAEEARDIYTKSPAWWEPGKPFCGGGTRRAPGEPREKVLRARDSETGKIVWEVRKRARAKTGTACSRPPAVWFSSAKTAASNMWLWLRVQHPLFCISAQYSLIGLAKTDTRWYDRMLTETGNMGQSGGRADRL
jgi:hypothetical protein